jgi:3-isopropylmalate/(R)-2-methylmalate dehydratase large subunit
MGQTLLEKVWAAHTVRVLPTGQTQVFIGLHLVHEVTTPQAFDALRQRGWPVRFPARTFATVDHIVPTTDVARPCADLMAEQMLAALERNCRDFGVPLYDLGHEHQASKFVTKLGKVHRFAVRPFGRGGRSSHGTPRTGAVRAAN